MAGVGRPTDYREEYIQQAIDYDRQCDYTEIEIGEFSCEEFVTQAVYESIDEFMQIVFNEKVKSATRKKSETRGCMRIQPDQLIAKRGARLDLWVECESGHKYIIEVKNPKNQVRHTIPQAIGQLLGYATVFPEATNLVLLTTSYCDEANDMINKFCLPIAVVVFGKNKIYLSKDNGKGTV